MNIIIGAGLSGLLTAYRLKKEGIPFKILEARSRIGGRINTVLGESNTPVELGATWFNSQHLHISALLKELNLNSFEQYMNGTVFYQPVSNEPAQAIQIPEQPPSYRINGGSSNLINTLYQHLDKNDILLDQHVTKIEFNNNAFKVTASKIFEADKVILAIPPKLWSRKISFHPELPKDLLNIATQTHTWMEDSIKVAITYKNDFWTIRDLSGALFSNSGPITELYDHCNANRSKFALCGFMKSSLKYLDKEVRKQEVMKQLEEVFGEQASNYLEYTECIWSNEKNTFEDTGTPIYPHQNNGNPLYRRLFYDGKLLISSSESSPEFPGYMDGAILAGNLTASKIIEATR